MQIILINMCGMFHYDRLRNDRALGNRKYENKNAKKNNRTTFVVVACHWGPVSGSNKKESIGLQCIGLPVFHFIVQKAQAARTKLGLRPYCYHESSLVNWLVMLVA